MLIQKKRGLLKHRYRYFILILATICLTSICSNMIALNFTFICMVELAHSSSKSIPINSSATVATSAKTHYRHHYLNYGQTEKAALLWAVAVGTLLSVWPHQYLLLRYGARYVLFVAGLLSALATAAIPLLAFLGLPWLIVARTVQGVAYGADFSAIGIITVRWASLKQNGLFIAVLTSFNNIASIVTNPLAGKLCQTKYGWPSVFYVHSFIGFIIMLAWVTCYEDDPKQHPQVSLIELEKIDRDKTEAHKNHERFVPYSKILKNLVILTVWLNAFLEIVSAQLLQTYGPTYMKKVLNFSIEDTGYLMAASVFMMLPIRYAAGYLSDKIKFISEVHKLRVFNTVSVGGCALFYALLGFVPCHTPYLAIAVISLINILTGINVGGFYKCATLVARHHSHFVISNIQFTKSLSLFVAPSLVAAFVHDDTLQEQWRTVFVILALAMLAANIVFCMMATDQPADFTKFTKAQTKRDDHVYVMSA